MHMACMPMATATQPITWQRLDAFSHADGVKHATPFLCPQHCWRFTVHSLPATGTVRRRVANGKAALCGHLTTMAAGREENGPTAAKIQRLKCFRFILCAAL